MRLGQAARNFETTTDQLVKMLAKHFREVNNHPNIKLTDEEVDFFESHFAPQPSEIISKEIKEEPPVPPAEEEPVQEKQSDEPQFVESLRPQVITLENEFDEKTRALEKFKAEKPELEGLKVLGKIELPEPVKKEVKEKKSKEPKDRRPSTRTSKTNRTDKNLAAEERKKQERIAKRKKYESEQRAKELKKKHYEENVKAKLESPKPKKKKRKVLEEQEAVSTPSSSKRATHQSKPSKQKAKGLKRFWLWLNGAYDKYQ